VRAGETLVVPKLDRLARSVPDARAIADELEKRGVSLALGKQVYEHATVTVINEEGRRRKVLTYRATADAIDDSLLPYSWYKDFVLAGCAEHNLPPDYVSRYVESVRSTEDPDRARDAREREKSTFTISK
jgi:hypothetical protein